ncbi:hypothetical protein WN51_10761 [Melipona quadrifasciata]|uniref:Uncharacterized protein n=1 Tax=Melipona quadrifasciata TaxID=166423 RepID=A0A0M9A486_9HYME|nr:hypothetical protein WN51_10761 [Melipona quadrifasciata]
MNKHPQPTYKNETSNGRRDGLTMCSLVALTSEGLQQDRTRIFSRETALILRCRLRTKQPKAVNDKRGEDRMWGAAHGQMSVVLGNFRAVRLVKPISAMRLTCSPARRNSLVDSTTQ